MKLVREQELRVDFIERKNMAKSRTAASEASVPF